MSLPTLHDPAVLQRTKQRVAALRPDAERRWGKMTVDQMLWHVNRGLENAIGRYEVEVKEIPLPSAVTRFIVLRLPWAKGRTPTAPEYVAKERYDFEAERSHLMSLIAEFGAKPLDSAWRPRSFMGKMTGLLWSQLQAKHLDHHLQQFGA